MGTSDILNRRQLNRITLERQLLLRRSTLSPLAAIEHLVGMQAQIPNAPYVGLWSRLRHFKADDLIQLLLAKKAVRMALMRSTIHLVTDQDCVGLRPLVQPALDRDLFQNSTYGPGVIGLDMEAALAFGRSVIASNALTPQEIGDRLHERFPDHPAPALAYAMRNLLPLVQLPPRGVWGIGGLTKYAVAQDWLDREVRAELTLERMVLRYLHAFGPATAQDIQAWSGLRRLQPVIDQLHSHSKLRVYRDESGKQLYDIIDAVHPSENLAAAPILLPEFDNLLFAFADRSRILDKEHKKAFVHGNRTATSVLIDGFIAGSWKITRNSKRAVLAIRTFKPLTAKDKRALAEEGDKLLEFTDENKEHEIHITEE